ncbi:cytochrome P450 [Nesterenkonia sp. NBAIMH1]|uniref:cytochrome P450 n=1 Tax=Nesterenkonia sp. NBAIMH1 TaxID=2600320 RepID=UPI0011B5E522|nr:cytochrome P450 [Nesterenkonia sp. NBAIMH1]
MSLAAEQHTRPAPVSELDPFIPENLGAPGAMHHQLRELGPVVHLSAYNVYAMARYEEVREALENWQEFSSGAGVGLSNFRYEKPWRPPSVLLETDPPRHDAPRAVLSKVLGPRQLRRFRESWSQTAESLVSEIIDRRAPSGGVLSLEAVEDLAEAYPLRVFPRAVGLDGSGLEHLLPYGDHAFNAFGPDNELVAQRAEQLPQLIGWVNEQCRRERLSDKGFGADIWQAADRLDITEEQAPLIVRSLLTAGVDTTVYGIAAVLYHLATNPEEYQRLRREPQLARAAVEEAFRLESPVQTFFRTALSDVRVGDVVIPDGHKILMFLGSANRDPRRWEDPDRFDLSRDPSGHVAFGSGLHQCVGQHVARLEAVCLLQAILPRVESLRLPEEPTRHLNNTLQGWERLPLEMTLA